MSNSASSSISNIVTKLPLEISLYIYTEFLETECKYELIMREFRSIRVQRLSTENLVKIMEMHYENKNVINYLRKREEEFDIYYRKLVIHGEYGFPSMARNNAVVNSWVMSVYH